MKFQEYQREIRCPFPRGSRRALAEAIRALAIDAAQLETQIGAEPMLDLVKLSRRLGVLLHDMASVATVAGVSLDVVARWNLEAQEDGDDAA